MSVRGEKRRLKGILRKITGRRQAEEALLATQARLQGVLAAVPAVIFSIRASGDFGIHFISENTREQFGYESCEFLADSSFWANHIHPEDGPRVFAELPHLFERGHLIVEYRFLGKDGIYRWIRDEHRLIRDADGNPLEVIGCGVDITERKQMEEALRKANTEMEGLIQERAAELIRANQVLQDELVERKRAEEAFREFEKKYRGVVENAVEIIYTTDAIGNFTYANAAGLKIAGYSLEELRRFNYLDLVVPEHRQRVSEIYINQFRERKKTSYVEFPYYSKSGEVIWFGQNASLVMEDGKVAGFHIIARDITERRRVEEALRESEERYRSILDNIQDGYFEVDITGNFTFFNDSLCRELGYSKEEMMGMSNRQYMDKETAQEVYQAFNRVYTTGEPYYSYDWEIIRKDGIKRIHESFISLIRNPKGERIGFRGITRDITERKQAEEDLRKSEEAARGLAQENACIAEIGRIISSTLKIEEVYELFAEEVQKLISFDRIVINLNNIQEDTITQLYVSGMDIEGKGVKDVIPLKGSTNEELMRTRSGLILLPQAVEELEDRFPALVPYFQSGLRSMMTAPLISRGEVIGALHFRTKKPEAYTSRDLILAERIASQIAGAITNAQLFSELKRTTENLAESELRYRDLIEAADQTGLGIVALQDVGQRKALCTFANKEAQKITEYTLEELQNLSWLEVIHPSFLEEASDRYRRRIQGEVLSGLYEIFLLKKSGREVCIENATSVSKIQGQPAHFIYFRDITERKEAEKALQQSEAEAQQLARENAIMAEIGRIISSTLNIEEVYERFANEVRKLIPSDRTSINIFNPEAGTFTNTYVTGVEVAGRRAGESYPLAGSISEEIMRTRKSILFQTEDQHELELHFPHLLTTFQSGLRSMISVPLISGDQVIGALHLRSIKSNAYSERDLKLAQRVGDQIAGAIANARLFAERKQAEETVQRQLQHLSALHEIDMTISASLDLRVTLNVLLNHVTTQLSVNAADILLLDPQTQMLEHAASHGFRSLALKYTHLRVGDGYAGCAALERRIIEVPDLAQAKNGLKRSPLLPDEGFVSYFAVPLIAKGLVKGVMEIFHRVPIIPKQEWLDFMETLARQAAIAIDNAELFGNLQRSNIDLVLAYDATLEGWSRALDLRDKETEGHSERVADMTIRLARLLGMPEAEIGQVRKGALLHDIGKMGIPDSILLKPGPLTEEEREIMHKHPLYAHKLLEPISFLRRALDIPHCHHEKWDGTGYPQGLKEKQIPLPARIFAVVDVWDALTSGRPYRAAWPDEKAREYIQEQAGKYFDPKVVEVFLQLETRGAKKRGKRSKEERGCNGKRNHLPKSQGDGKLGKNLNLGNR